jgi:hypothetical protein
MGVWIDDRVAQLLVRNAATLLGGMERIGVDVAGLYAAAHRYESGAADRPAIQVPWITVDQATTVLGVARRTVQTWCATGYLDAVQEIRPGATRATWRINPESASRLRSERQRVAGPRRPRS